MKVNKRYIDIRAKLLGLAIVPVILLAIILGYYLIKTRIDDVNASLMNKGELITKNFAPAVEFGLFTQNTELLELLSQPILHDSEVISVTIYDQNESLVLNTYSQNHSPESVETFGNELTTFRSSVVSTRLLPIGVGDDQSIEKNSRVMGWVEVKMSHHSLNQRQLEIIETSVVLVAAILLVCIFVAIRIGIRVSTPILSLTRMVESIGKGDYEVRTDENASGELGSLQVGINAMAEIIQASHGRMKDEIEVSTIALRHTINALEEKNTELEHAKYELEDAVHAKSEFLAKMSHEIRTPLNAVIGFTRLIEKTKNKHELEEYTRTIKHAGSQLLTVIDDILSFSKLEKADVQFQNTPFDLRDCLEDMLSMFSPLARAKELQLVLLIDLDVPSTLIGDSLRINQVLSNLISNALKFTSHGAVTVKVSLIGNEKAKPIIRFVVNDTGIGIQLEKEKLLFKAFSQLDANLSRQYEGAGLGLAISKRIIELMGGRIGVESTYQKGSNFWFELPCQVGYEAKGITGKSLAGYSVLLFDLYPASRLAIRNYFLSWQVNLYVAKNCSELHERLSDATLYFDLVVVSLGYEDSSTEQVEFILEEIKKYNVKYSLILVCSNYQKLKKNYSIRRDVMVLEKPIRKHKLYERIVEFFNISSSSESNSEKKYLSIKKESTRELPVLVAEDNEFNSILISAMLEERGYQVTCCSNGKEILNLLPNKKFILFFIDIHMPDMDGYELALKCRREKLIEDDVPVIAFTADIMLRQIDSLSDYGFNDVLYKPISNESLGRLLDKWVYTTPDEMDKSGFLNILDSTDMQKRLHDDIMSKVKYLKEYSVSLDADEARDCIHQLEGLLGYYQFTGLLFTLKEIKQAISENDKDNVILKLDQLETEVLLLKQEKDELIEETISRA